MVRVLKFYGWVFFEDVKLVRAGDSYGVVEDVETRGSRFGFGVYRVF